MNALFANEERKIIDGLKKLLEAELLLARSQLFYLKKQSHSQVQDLPTLTSLSAVLVGVADEIFAIPETGVAELLQLNSDDATSIKTVSGLRVLMLQDRMIPLIALGEMLGICAPGHEVSKESLIVVSQPRNFCFGLCVDEILGTERIEIKPVTGIFESLNTFAGAALLGDGRAVILLDLNDLAACQPDGSV